MKKYINKIELIREEINNEIINKKLTLSHLKEVFSPSNTFLLKVSEYNGSRIQLLQIIEASTNKTLQVIRTNDYCFYSFVIKNNTEYLLFAEDYNGGQSIVDLENNQLASFTSRKKEGFIWTSHHLSPNEDLLVVIGCFWAWPLFIKVYKFDDPMHLPLEEICSIDFETSSVNSFIKWIDNDSFQIEMSDQSENIIKLNLAV